MNCACITRLLVVAAIVCCAATLEAEPDDAFARGNAEYAAGHFREAADLYESAVRVGETSANLFYNLGNASFRAGDAGRAILNYERALSLEPHHPEATANLQVTRDKTHALELRRMWWEHAAGWATVRTYSIVAAVSFWIAAVALVARVLARRRSALALAVGALALLTLATAVAGAYSLETGSTGRGVAVILANKIDARIATADNAAPVLALPAGSEVKILSNRGEWVYAALPNNLRGWIPAQAAEPVRL
jgi:tetratricopeptide (TPR) repeat protein